MLKPKIYVTLSIYPKLIRPQFAHLQDLLSGLTNK
jgi:hypothetical protein